MNHSKIEQAIDLRLMSPEEAIRLSSLSADDLGRELSFLLGSIDRIKDVAVKHAESPHMWFLISELAGNGALEFECVVKPGGGREQARAHERRTRPVSSLDVYEQMQNMREKRIGIEKDRPHADRMRYEYLIMYRRQIMRSEIMSDILLQDTIEAQDKNKIQASIIALQEWVLGKKRRLSDYYGGETIEARAYEPVKEMFEIDNAERNICLLHHLLAMQEVGKHRNEVGSEG